MIRRACLTAITLLLASSAAVAQPYAFVTHTQRGSFSIPRLDAISVINLGTTAIDAIEIPAGVTAGSPVLDPVSGRMLVITAFGTAQIQVRPLQLLPQLLPWTGRELFLSPDGLYAYVCAEGATEVCTLRRRSDDAAIGTLTSVRTVLFDSAGGHIVVRTSGPSVETLAYAPAGAPLQPLWSRDTAGSFGPVFVDGDVIVLNPLVNGARRIVAVETLSGATLQDVPAPPGQLVAAADGRLFQTYFSGTTGLDHQRLQSFDRATLTSLADVAVGDVFGQGTVTGLAVRGDRLIVSVVRIRGGVGSVQRVFDTTTLAVVPGGAGAAGLFGPPAISGDPWCEIAPVLSPTTLPSEGGILDVSVTVSPHCDPWPLRPFVQDDVFLEGSSGSRSGNATVRLHVGPNLFTVNASRGAFAGPHMVSALQAGQTAPPDAPRITGVRVNGALAVVSWEPAPGGPLPVSGFVIEAGALGGPVAAQFVALATSRSVTLPGVSAGTYFVQVRGHNIRGPGVASAPITFTIAPSAPPSPPTGLTGETAGATVRLRWTVPGSGPPPAFYVIEGGLAGGPFAEVARTTDSTTEFLVGSVPAGSYQVRVRSGNSVGLSDASAPVPVTPTVCTSPPDAPGPVRRIAVGALTTLIWSAPVSGADRYVIEGALAANAGATFEFTTTSPATLLNVAAPVGAYRIRVRGLNGCGRGAASPEVVLVVPSVGFLY